MSAPVTCRGCGAPVDAVRACYAVPTCEACLPVSPCAPEPRSAVDAAQDASGAWEPPALPGEAWRDSTAAVVALIGDRASVWFWWFGPDARWIQYARGSLSEGSVFAAWAMAERARADRAEAALAAFQRYTGHADAVSLAEAIKAAERRGDA